MWCKVYCIITRCVINDTTHMRAYYVTTTLRLLTKNFSHWFTTCTRGQGNYVIYIKQNGVGKQRKMA